MTDLDTAPETDHPLLAGRYRVVRRLGAGGMGEVFLVEDLKLDGRQFAVKMLPSFLSGNRRAMASLKREALHAMELSHPHIVTVRGFEETEAGQPFLVMDYIEGRTLEDLLVDRERLPEDEVIRLFTPIAEALDHAHSKGVIHRDVKPSNIMIRTDGTPVIMDFGVAREVKETSTLVTGAETASGTLPYMSPEQLKGSRPASAQDIYSLAAAIWECVFGEPPFCRGDVRHQILHEVPEPVPGVVRDETLLGGVVIGLAKTADERPSSCLGIFRGTPSAGTIGGRSGHEDSDPRPHALSGGDAEDLLDLEVQAREAIGSVESMRVKLPALESELDTLLARCGHLQEIAADYKKSRLWMEAAGALRRINSECQAVTESCDDWTEVLQRFAEADALATELLGRIERLGEQAGMRGWARERCDVVGSALRGLQASMAALHRQSLEEGLEAFLETVAKVEAEAAWRGEVFERVGKRVAALERDCRALVEPGGGQPWAQELRDRLSKWLADLRGLYEAPGSSEVDRLVVEIGGFEEIYRITEQRRVQNDGIEREMERVRRLAAALHRQVTARDFEGGGVEISQPHVDSVLLEIEEDARALRYDAAHARAVELIGSLTEGLALVSGNRGHGTVAAGATHSLILSESGRLTAFGNGSSGQCDVPDAVAQMPSDDGELIVSIAAGAEHSLVLTSEGRVLGWGAGEAGASAVPPALGNGSLRAVRLASGSRHAVAIVESGEVLAWGRNTTGQCVVPREFDGTCGAAVAIACGDSFSLAVRDDGEIRVWGSNSYSQCSIPIEIGRAACRFASIACGTGHIVAMTIDGEVMAWGDDRFGQVSGPSGLRMGPDRQVVAVGATHYQSIVLWSDGSLQVFGARSAFDSAPSLGQRHRGRPIESGHAEISAGRHHCLVRVDNGDVLAFGDSYFGQSEIPGGAL